MIVPIHGLKYHRFQMPQLFDTVLMVKEKHNLFDKNAIAAYNSKKQKVGYVSRNGSSNTKVYDKMKEDHFVGKVWAIFPNQILVELDF